MALRQRAELQLEARVLQDHRPRLDARSEEREEGRCISDAYKRRVRELPADYRSAFLAGLYPRRGAEPERRGGVSGRVLGERARACLLGAVVAIVFICMRRPQADDYDAKLMITDDKGQALALEDMNTPPSMGDDPAPDDTAKATAEAEEKRIQSGIQRRKAEQEEKDRKKKGTSKGFLSVCLSVS